MAVYIGQASIDERSRITGGQAGSQNGKELNIRTYYKSSWKYVLRCKDSAKAVAMANECRNACNNYYIGYDQSQRNTLRTQAKAYGYNLANIRTACECDCSSLMAVCAECVGINVYTSSNAPTTANMVTAFRNSGMFDVLTDSKYTGSDAYLQAGDILVKSGHTVMVLNSANTATTAPTVSTGYVISKTYTTNVNLNVRDSANGTQLKYDALTQNAKANAVFDEYGRAILKKGTRVTCKAVKTLDTSTWIQIPSGWICAKNNGKVYIE